MAYLQILDDNSHYNPPSSHEIWKQCAKYELSWGRQPIILCEHIKQQYSLMKAARSKIAPPDSSQSGQVIVNSLLELLPSPKSPKSWWNINVVKKVYTMQVQFETQLGMHSVQTHAVIDDLLENVKNKHNAQELIRSTKIRKIEESQRETREDKKQFRAAIQSTSINSRF